MGRLLLLGAVAAALALASAAAGGGFPRFGDGCTRDDFGGAGGTVGAELCRPPQPTPAAVVVLHGCAHVPASLYVYPHGSHDWPGRQGSLGIAHAAAFLLRYLR